MKNLKWKEILWLSGKTNRWISQRTGIPESYLSLAINGRLILTDDQKKAIAEALDLTESELFT